jgi:hypothetical protein
MNDFLDALGEWAIDMLPIWIGLAMLMWLVS